MAVKTYQQCQIELMDAYDALQEYTAEMETAISIELSRLHVLENAFKQASINMAMALKAAWLVGEAKATIPA